MAMIIILVFLIEYMHAQVDDSALLALLEDPAPHPRMLLATSSFSS
jgi:hypothetical protein